MSASMKRSPCRSAIGRAEGVALLHVGAGEVDGALGDADGLGPDGGPAAVEGVHGDGEALALLADAVRGRDADFVEDDLTRGAAAQPHLVLELGDLDPPLLLDQEAARCPGRRRRGRSWRRRCRRRRSPALVIQYLEPAQHVVVAVAHGPGPHGGDVAAGVGLGEAVARLDLAGGHAGHVLLLQLLGSPVQDRHHAELGDEHGDARRRADAGELLDHDRLRDGSAPAPP